MGYPKYNMQYLTGVAEAIDHVSADTLNVSLKKHYDSRNLVYLQIALALWEPSYKGPFNGQYTDNFASTLDNQWSQAWASEPSGKYKKDSQGNYPLAFFRDMINGDGGLGTTDAPPVTK